MKPAEQVRTIEHWIGGKRTPGTSTRHAPLWNPVTGEQQAQVALANTRDVDEPGKVLSASSWGRRAREARMRVRCP